MNLAKENQANLVSGWRTASKTQQPPRSPRLHRHPARRRLLAQDARLRRPGLPGRRRLHGPGQLGHRPRRRRALRLHAAQRHPDLQPDGDPAAGARRRASASPADATSPRPAATATRGRPRSFLWILCEIAIAACDLAEVLGAAIALNLLFGLPLIWGVCLTALDVLVVLLPAAPRLPLRRGARHHAHRRSSPARSPSRCGWRSPTSARSPSASSRAPRSSRNREMLYIAIGILGATVMPHNLYLHSSIVQTRKYLDTQRRQARGDPASRPSTRRSR